MALQDIRDVRLKKLNNILKAGINPYPSKTERSLMIEEAVGDFDDLVSQNKILILAGRLRSLRLHGGSAFCHIEDASGQIQIYLKQDILKEKYKFFIDNFDVGDFVEIKGRLFKTQKDEKTLEAGDYKILAKALRPLPDKWHGLKDVEERFRKRYLDLLFNPEVKTKFAARSKIIGAIRQFLEKEGFLEVETSVLQPIYGGARAKPFKTHLNVLDLDLYLRIAPELYLKRLLVGGFEKIYEIGRVFRNEGIDWAHNPDYTHLEFYWAFADDEDLMQMTEKMFEFVLKQVGISKQFVYQGQKINFAAPWSRIDFCEFFKKEAGIDLDKANLNILSKKAEELVIQIEKGASEAEIIDVLYKKLCRPKIWQPCFIVHYPIGFQPLAKTLEKEPKKLANFQLVVGGMEICNAFSELNDALEQRKRFQAQEKLFKEGLEEAHRLDEDFLEALEYGMPPAAGFGLGIDRLVALLTDSHSLREIILFPTMKPRKK